MKRRLFKLAFFLILGAVVNVAVAWGCATSHGKNPPVNALFNAVISATGFEKVALQLNATDYPKDSYLSVVLEYQEYDLSVITIEKQNYVSGKTWTKTREEMSVPHIIVARIWRKGFEQRVIIYGSFAPPKTCRLVFVGNYRLTQILVGWPLKSLYYTPSYQVPSGSGLNTIYIMMREEKVWRLPNVFGKLFPSISELILPYGVIWPGFAINTVFYATILWLLTLGPFTARRSFRHKRGLCIKCGYDLRGKSEGGCPECGWGREAGV